MSRIPSAFAKGKALIGYVTGGDPSIKESEEYILSLIDAGASLIEIGIPFSDPIAEGPVIQTSSLRALSVGTTIEDVFSLVSSLRQRTDIPLVLLTYLNPVLHYGYEAFFARCEQTGVDGIIVPDLPFDEKDEIDSIAKSYTVDVISMIAPTSAQRVAMIAAQATGFIYLVSSLGVTGVRSSISTDIDAIISVIRSITTVPIAVGFGIHTPEQAHAIAQKADGVIVGSGIVKRIAANPDKATQELAGYFKELRIALDA